MIRGRGQEELKVRTELRSASLTPVSGVIFLPAPLLPAPLLLICPQFPISSCEQDCIGEVISLMRRIDAIGIGLGIFIAGGLVYLGFQLFGLDAQQAGIWSQALLVVGLIGWLATYVLRAVGKKMTYHQQRDEYEEAFLQKRLDELSPEELARIQAEIAQEEQSQV